MLSSVNILYSRAIRSIQNRDEFGLCWLLRISVLKLGAKQCMRNILATCLIRR